MRDRLIKLIRQPIPIIRGYATVGETRISIVDAEKIADRLLANGVIVPPCKVGDTVWYPTTECDGCKSMDDWCHKYCKKKKGLTKVESATVEKIEIENGNFKYAGTTGRTEDHRDHFFRFEDFGKKVFLTREEAEKALKGGAEE